MRKSLKIITQPYSIYYINSILFHRIAGSNIPASASRVKKYFRAAWEHWSNAAAMKFRKRDRKEADIVISFHDGGETSPHCRAVITHMHIIKYLTNAMVCCRP